MFIAGFISIMLFVGGGIATPYNTYVAVGLYISSPLPLIVYKVTRTESQQQSEPPKEPSPTEDPVAPTPDEPSAV